MARQTSTPRPAVADICLYGVPQTCGAGYLGVTYPHGQTFGTGDPVKGRTYTAAIYAAVADLATRGVRAGLVRIFDAGGERVAVVDLGGAIPPYGMLTWGDAPVYTISADALIAAADGQGN